MSSLEDLKKKRTVVKAKATRFKNFIRDYIPNVETVFDLESRMDKFDDLWAEYDKIQYEIDALAAEPEAFEREQFENAFFQTINVAKKKKKLCDEQINQASVRAESALPAQSQSSGLSHARLPIITLPSFDGSYERWQSFYDTFVAMVDRNTTLDTITKFHYLQSALTGKAKEYINSFEVTEENYPIVLELLKKRYHNLRLIVNHHVQQLFNLPQVTRDSAGGLRTLVDNLQKHTRILAQLGEPVDKWDTLLIYFASTRLDHNTKREWELKVISEKLSKLVEFIDFLEVRCQMFEAVTPNGCNTMVASKMGGANHGIKRETRSLAHMATGNPTSECVICQQDHKIYSCQAFRDLSIDEKRNKIRDLRLCFNCLGSRHSAKECKSARTCKHCEGRHHSLLHKSEWAESSSNGKRGSEKGCDGRSDVNTEQGESSSCHASVAMIANREVGDNILSTAIVYVRSASGENIKARALLDNGSMSNFMTKGLCDRLRLQKNQTNHVISEIDLTQTNVSSYVSTTVGSVQNKYKVKSDFLITNDISHCIPTRAINKKEIVIPKHIILADPDYADPKPVDLLLGTTVFWDALVPQQIKQGQWHPVQSKSRARPPS